ncbi:glucan biosynthesis protein G [Larsenimonas suaedae]|uniref:Glucans biosynthesis protein G n=1 Tax=Larsenimonas suaedae TaxID=1851019 RepID=A0ABU1GXG3_9GAMM|nr:glucan biosynthesis protein G [Larsenimonas suaedae]MCM2971479.1 glucan biosynthesis protein G [Larsenimonas suaedae]MDR5896735.1 glucan biosynthesis protein G [Larsenimonas suaedae]
MTHHQSFERSESPRASHRLPLVAFSLASLLCAQQAFAFGFQDVADQAKSLAKQNYSQPESNLPDELAKLKYKDYAKIQFKADKSLWRDENLPFDLSFFHQGMHYDTPVTINEIDGPQADDVHEVKYSPDDFDFGDLKLDKSKLSDLGFAGFKVNYPINSATKQEVMVFLGASYFRVIGENMRYGLSGRGLAIDTALSSGEEFPRFKEFWIAKPEKGDKYLTIFALMDSPSMTGAYRFILRPGEDSVVDVKSRIFRRHEVTKLGVAPLTSMFLFGPSQPNGQLNYRPAIHDSNGLAVNSGDNDWLWRPLQNPKKLQVNSFDANSPRGFGLLQRSHDFHDYEDLHDRYDLRPSAWIQPTNDWGQGQVELVQIPTPNETNDNIVAYWRPTNLPGVDQPLNYDYRISWTLNEPKYHSPDNAWVSQTRRSQGEVLQDNLIRKSDGTTEFVLDFKGPNLKSLDGSNTPKANVSAGDNGDISRTEVQKNPATGGYRLTLNVKPKDSAKPIELRAYLTDGQGGALSETWSYMLQAANE